MRKIILLFLFTLLGTNSLVGQDNLNEGKTKNNVKNIQLKNSNSWAFGGGVSNFIMHGDLRSIGTGNLGNFYNFGAYAYVDKMFNPLLGMEFKINYSKISGGAQYFSDVYDILYVNQTQISNNLFFKGTAYGAELNLILIFSNLYETTVRRWHATGYFGAGYHQYDSALYQKLPDGSNNVLVDFGINPSRNGAFEASSIYLSGQLGIKYKLSTRVDLEFRPSWYFNYEDHLDATISNKQDWETFFVTHIGIVIKLGSNKVFTIWGNGPREKFEKFKIVDTDNDGVIDQLDKDPNTPVGVQVYGSGKGIDSDQDGVQDYKDKCPFTPGPVTNKGCPVEVPVKISPSVIKEQIALLATSIYFKTDSHTLKQNSLTVLDDIIGLMKNIPDSNFIIEGHTDNIGRPAYNLKLSLARVEAVKEYLINAEIDNNRLKTLGYGQTRPRYSNRTPGGRQLNRRVEIKPITKDGLENLNLPNEIKINSIKPKTNKVPEKINSPLSEVFHTVKKGETLYRLASDNNTSVQEIMETNNLEDAVLSIGQKIKITKYSKQYHTVRESETLYSIALKYQLSVEELRSINQLKNNTIYINQVLKIKKK